MPLTDERLVVAPSYPNAAGLMAIGQQADAEERSLTLVNRWYAATLRCDIVIFRDANGKLDWGKLPAFHSLQYAMRTLGCSEAWGIEQESNAVKLLGEHLRHHQFKQYLLTGTFLEKSQRSGLFYMFRRLRPTVVIRAEPTDKDSSVICALCAHPIAHYAGSWAGAMCPTDDVVAHLMMMRGDERLFWKRSTQHPAWRPEAGL